MQPLKVRNPNLDLFNSSALDDNNGSGLPILSTKSEKGHRRNSPETVFEEILKLDMQSLEMAAAPQLVGGDPLQNIEESPEDHSNEHFWGYVVLKGVYNNKRENLIITLLKLKPTSSYWKIFRNHVCVMKMFVQKDQKGNVNEFYLNELTPSNATWTIENILTDHLKKAHFKVELYRTRNHHKKRLIGRGEFQLVDLLLNKNPLKLLLEIKYKDKPPMPTKPKESEKETEVAPKSENDSDSFDDENSDIEVKICEMIEPIPEMLIAMEYDAEKSVVILKIEKCCDLFLVNKNNVRYTKSRIKCILHPEKIKCSTFVSEYSFSPMFGQIFHISISKDDLDIGDFTFFVYKGHGHKKLFTVKLDRATNEHWREVLSAPCGMIYRWHELQICYK